MDNACLEAKDEEKESALKKKEREKSYDTVLMLSWSNLMAAEINERANGTNSSPVTRLTHRAQLVSVENHPPTFDRGSSRSKEMC